MKTCKIVLPKKSPKRGIPINEFIKKYMNKIIRVSTHGAYNLTCIV